MKIGGVVGYAWEILSLLSVQRDGVYIIYVYHIMTHKLLEGFDMLHTAGKYNNHE